VMFTMVATHVQGAALKSPLALPELTICVSACLCALRRWCGVEALQDEYL
jgi:hypothetical protein